MPDQKNEPLEPFTSFEAQLERLQQIVKALDDPSIPLAEMLALYREGMTLTQTCRHVLDSASQQISEIGMCDEQDFTLEG